MAKKKKPSAKKEGPPKRRYKKPILRRVEMKDPSVGFTPPTFPDFRCG